MGVLTALYYVKYPIFDRMAAEDRLDKLVAVLNGYQPPQEIGLSEGHVFPVCSLDKSWEDFRYALRGIDGQGLYYDLQKHLQVIEHDWAAVFFWWPEALVEGLSAFRSRLMTKTGLEFPGCLCEYDPKQVIIPPSNITEAMDALEERVMARLAEGEPWDDWSGDPFNQISLSYVLSYFTRMVIFLTNSLTYGEDERLVKADGQVVIGISS